MPACLLSLLTDWPCTGVQGPLAKGLKVTSHVKLADGAKLKGGLATINCKTRMGPDKAQAAQVGACSRAHDSTPLQLHTPPLALLIVEIAC